MESKKSIFISAGDPSADFPGKNLIAEIAKRCNDIEIFGLGGPLMQDVGLKPMADYRKLAVLGFWEIVPQFFYFRQLMNQCVAEIKKRQPRVIILLDYPGFNLRLARKVKSLGIPIVYYISPQVWAWGKKRVDHIRDLIDLMLVIFPFEEEFYHLKGIEARFVGHPLVDRYGEIPSQDICRKRLEVAENKRLIAILPGSRTQEVKRMLPAMVAATDKLNRNLPDYQYIIGAVQNVDQGLYKNIVGERKIDIVIGVTPCLMRAADLVITSSGTATIETAFFETPMVVIYKTGWLTYQIARQLIELDMIGMVNIVAGKKIVPELIQNEASPGNLAETVASILTDDKQYQDIKIELKKVCEKLGRGETGQRTLDAIMERVPLC